MLFVGSVVVVWLLLKPLRWLPGQRSRSAATLWLPRGHLARDPITFTIGQGLLDNYLQI